MNPALSLIFGMMALGGCAVYQTDGAVPLGQADKTCTHVLFADALTSLPMENCKQDGWECGIAMLQNRAAQGDRLAQYNLALRYYTGTSIKQDRGEAALWFRRAAQAELPQAAAIYGLMYANGIAIPRDDMEAGKWLRLAAEANNPTAQKALGLMYGQGCGGIPTDRHKARFWLLRAAEQGDSAADALLSSLK